MQILIIVLDYIMLISIHLGSNHKILLLAHQIVKDWCQKISAQAPDLKKQYRVAIVDERTPLGKQLTDATHLIIVLEGLHMRHEHILSLSQQLSTFGQKQQPFVPSYLAQITIANSIAITIIQNFLFSMSQSPQNSSRKSLIHKMSCVECVKYFGAFNISTKANNMISNSRGANILDGGAPFYAYYPTKKGLLAVGNLEPKFYQQMIEQMKLSKQDTQFCLQNQLNMEAWPQLRNIFANKFLQKSAEDWEKEMSTRDTCITAVRDINKQSENFLHPYLISPKL